ncbi:MAG TPA: AI-2E family transporter [Gemmatimonadaceae bacterium]
MTSPNPAGTSALDDRIFHLLIVAVSLALVWILRPFSGAILWGIVFAVLFVPLYRRLSRSMHQRRTLAALGTLAIILVMVILPLTLIGAALLQEGFSTYERIQSGEMNFGRYFQQVFDALPAWLTHLLDRVGLTNLDVAQERLAAGLTRSVQFLAARALDIGQNTAAFIVDLFIMLYLLFFLLRDGDDLSRRIRDAIPLSADLQRSLVKRFTTVIRATVKGNLVVAVAQGALGGLIFWILGIHAPVVWGALMAVLSLLPAIGAAVVWLPVAIYLVVTGSTWQGIVLAAYGVLVIGTVDNILRPILVGKDTKMPDYVVLVSTLGGIATFGVNGFVIGPVIATMFMTVWDIFSVSRAETRTGAAAADFGREQPAHGTWAHEGAARTSVNDVPIDRS